MISWSLPIPQCCQPSSDGWCWNSWIFEFPVILLLNRYSKRVDEIPGWRHSVFSPVFSLPSSARLLKISWGLEGGSFRKMTTQPKALQQIKFPFNKSGPLSCNSRRQAYLMRLPLGFSSWLKGVFSALWVIRAHSHIQYDLKKQNKTKILKKNPRVLKSRTIDGQSIILRTGYNFEHILRS